VTSNGVTVTGAAGGQPVVAVTRGEPSPTELVAVDVYPGNGAELETGGSGVFEYEGVLFSDGTTFDSSWERGSPVSLTLERVIPGWQKGLVGMQVGGRRLLIIPPVDAYGAQALPGIPPNSTLVFVVDLVEVTG
jgi:peptidylprolyl isomerase